MSKETIIPEKVLYVCTGSKCKKRGSKNLYKYLKQAINDFVSRKKVNVIQTKCTDRCKLGPIVVLQPNNEWFLHMDEMKGLQLVHEKILEKKAGHEIGHGDEHSTGESEKVV